METKESIYHEPTSFEEIGIANKFDLKNAAEKARYTDLIDLPGLKDGSFCVCALKTKAQRFGHSINADEYYVFLFKKDNENLIPVGHIDIRMYDNEMQFPKGQLNNLDSIDIYCPDLPDYIKDLAGKFHPFNQGFMIDEEFQNQKLGKVLLAIGLGFIELQGAKAINIVDDASPIINGKTLYEHYGAKRYHLGKMKVEWLGEIVEEDIEIEYSLTHLLPQQEIIVAESFGINLL